MELTKTHSDETEAEWRRRLDHRLSNIERLLFHLRDEVDSKHFLSQGNFDEWMRVNR